MSLYEALVKSISTDSELASFKILNNAELETLTAEQISHLLALAIEFKQIDMFAILANHSDDVALHLESLKQKGHIQLATYLETSITMLAEIEDLADRLIKNLEIVDPSDPAAQAIDKVLSLTNSATLQSAGAVFLSIKLFIAADNLLQAISAYASKKQDNPDITTLIQREINFTYHFWATCPSNPHNFVHLINRLTSIRKNYLSSNPTQTNNPLFQFIKEFYSATESMLDVESSSQNWMIGLLSALKDNPESKFENRSGECAGFSYMALQAIIADDLKTWKERIELIQNSSPKELCETIITNRQQIAKKSQEQKNYIVEQSEQDLIDLEGYLQGVAFAQAPQFHPEFTIPRQNVLEVSTILMSKKLEAMHGLKLINSNESHYNLTNLTQYLNLLRHTLQKRLTTDPHLALYTTGGNHAILISYDLTSNHWIFIDINESVRYQEIASNWLLASKMLTTLSHAPENHISEIKIDTYVSHQYANILETAHQHFQIHPLIQRIHNKTINETLKNQLSSFIPTRDTSAIDAAILSDKPELVSYLLESKEESYNLTLRNCAKNKIPEIMNMVLGSRAYWPENEITNLLCDIISENKMQHFFALLQSNHTSVKEALHTKCIDYIRIFAKSNDFYDFIFCDEMKFFDPNWINDHEALCEFLKVLTVKQAMHFIELPSTKNRVSKLHDLRFENYYFDDLPEAIKRTLARVTVSILEESKSPCCSHTIITLLKFLITSDDRELLHSLLSTKNRFVIQSISELDFSRFFTSGGNPAALFFPETERFIPHWFNKMAMFYNCRWLSTPIDEFTNCIQHPAMQKQLKNLANTITLNDLNYLLDLANFVNPDSRASIMTRILDLISADPDSKKMPALSIALAWNMPKAFQTLLTDENLRRTRGSEIQLIPLIKLLETKALRAEYLRLPEFQYYFSHIDLGGNLQELLDLLPDENQHLWLGKDFFQRDIEEQIFSCRGHGVGLAFFTNATPLGKEAIADAIVSSFIKSRKKVELVLEEINSFKRHPEFHQACLDAFSRRYKSNLPPAILQAIRGHSLFKKPAEEKTPQQVNTERHMQEKMKL